MEKNKYTLYTIIVLLIIFGPCSIYGTYMHFKTTANLKHEFKFNDKLYFYQNDKLLGTYECKSSNCDYAIFSNNNLKSAILNNRYAFISDDENIYLYDIISGKSFITYNEVQKVAEGIFLVAQKNLWGAITIGNTINSLFNCNFDSIEFKNNKFITSKDNTWTLYQGQNELFKSEIKIKDFNENFVILTTEDNDKLLDYQNNEYLNMVANKTLSFVENYILLKRENNYYLYQIDNNQNNESTIISNFYYEGLEKVDYKITESSIDFYAGEQLLKSVEQGS